MASLRLSHDGEASRILTIAAAHRHADILSDPDEVSLGDVVLALGVVDAWAVVAIVAARVYGSIIHVRDFVGQRGGDWIVRPHPGSSGRRMIKFVGSMQFINYLLIDCSRTFFVVFKAHT